MLEIKPKLHLKLPHMTLRMHRLELSQAVAEDDELIVAIDTDAETHDNDWELSERPDTGELTEYLDKIEDDILHDPQWQQVDEQ